MLLPSILYGAESKRSSINDTYLIKAALLNGFSGVDSAAILETYVERDAGKAIKQSNLERNKVWIQSKFTPDICRYQYGYIISCHNKLVYDLNASERDQVRQSFHWSLNSLQADYLDSYLLHCLSDDISLSNISRKDLRIWQEFENLRSEGLVRQIGISNVNLNELQKLMDTTKIKPAIVQNFGFDTLTLQYCLENAIHYQVVQLLKHKELLDHHNLIDIANKYDITTGQVLIKFALLVGMHPILGTTQEKHMKEAMSLKFDLYYDEVRSIANLFPKPDLIFSIYLKLQNGELITQHDIADIIINSDPIKLGRDLDKVIKYIPKIDPSTLAYITEKIDIWTISYLKDNGAKFDLLNNIERSNIIKSHSSELIDQLDIFSDEEQLTEDTEYYADSTYSLKLFTDAVYSSNPLLLNNIIEDIKNNKLSNYLIEGIKLAPYSVISDVINAHPEVSVELIQAKASSIFVIDSLSTFNDSSYFDSIINSLGKKSLQDIVITDVIANKCRYNYNANGGSNLFAVIKELYEVNSLSQWEQQKETRDELIHCCKEQMSPSIILECYGKQVYEFDEL